MKRVCVYCGSSPGARPEYLEMAEKLGSELAKRKLELVYGGASIGIMGKLADSVLDAGGKVIGVIPKSLENEVAHRALSELHVVDTMHARKSLMFELSDAFIALPGGFGTLEEILEVLTWGQLNFHSKPCGFLNVCGYYEKLIDFLSHAVSEGFVKKEHFKLPLHSESPGELLDGFSEYKHPNAVKWH